MTGKEIGEDKVALTRKRAELIESLTTQLSPQDRVHVQGALSLVNAKIKAINTITAAKLKAGADRRKIAGLAEAQANATRARANAGLRPASTAEQHRDDLDCPDRVVGCRAESESDDDPRQTAAIDSWVDAVLLRHDVEFIRDGKGRVRVFGGSVPQDPAVIELLVSGIYAAGRDQELPDLPDLPAPAPKAPKAPKKAAVKPKKR